MPQKLDELRTLAIKLFEAGEKVKGKHGKHVWGHDPRDWRDQPSETIEVWEAVAREAYARVTIRRVGDETERANEAEEALRQISVMVCDRDPSDDEGSSVEGILEDVEHTLKHEWWKMRITKESNPDAAYTVPDRLLALAVMLRGRGEIWTAEMLEERAKLCEEAAHEVEDGHKFMNVMEELLMRMRAVTPPRPPDTDIQWAKEPANPWGKTSPAPDPNKLEKAVMEKTSVFKGEEWDAYRPGEDKQFPEKFVSRRKGAFCTVVNTIEELRENAKLCQVTLRWRDENLAGAGSAAPRDAHPSGGNQPRTPAPACHPTDCDCSACSPN